MYAQLWAILSLDIPVVTHTPCSKKSNWRKSDQLWQLSSKSSANIKYNHVDELDICLYKILRLMHLERAANCNLMRSPKQEAHRWVQLTTDLNLGFGLYAVIINAITKKMLRWPHTNTSHRFYYVPENWKVLLFI